MYFEMQNAKKAWAGQGSKGVRFQGLCPVSPLLAALTAEAGGACCQHHPVAGLSQRFPQTFCTDLVSPLRADSDLGGLQESGSEVRSLSSPVPSKTSVSTIAQLSYCFSEIKQHYTMQTYTREFKTGMGLPERFEQDGELGLP